MTTSEQDLQSLPTAEETSNLQKQANRERKRADLEKLISEAYALFLPDKQLTVSEWAEKYRFMSSEETPNPGMWSNDRVPYLKEIMDSFNAPDIERIAFIKPTQIGGTESGINILAYVIHQQPGRLLYVMPDEDALKEFSADRFQKVLRCNKCFDRIFQDNDSKNNMLRFTGGFCKFGSAGSPTDLASWSVPTIVMDEVDKYPQKSGKEADPLSLAEERTKNWPGRKKMFFWSTPTTKLGNIWKLWESVNIQKEYVVPCPECGEYMPLEWSQVKFDTHNGPAMAEQTAYYECKHCKAHITDKDKPEMLKKGHWTELNEFKGTVRSVGYRLNSLYSPWVTFGRMARTFMDSKDEPTKLQNFVNSWLGEPWELKSAVMDVDIVAKHRSECPMFKVPEWAQVLTGGVDVQKDHLYWSIHAWGPSATSQVVGYGRVRDIHELDKIMSVMYPNENPDLPPMRVSVYGIDTGYRTNEVYEYCWEHQWVAVPVKGSSTQMNALLRHSNIDPKIPGKQPLQLWIVNTDLYKNEIADRLERPIGRSSWILNADCSREYCEHLTAEHRIIDQKGYEKWVKKTSAKQNHWWDCAVYAFAVGDLVNIRGLQEVVRQETYTSMEAGEGTDSIPEPGFEL